MLQKLAPDLLVYLPALGLIIIILYLYFSNKISKDKVNPYLLVGIVCAMITYIIEYIVNQLLKDGLHNSSEILKWYPVVSLSGNFNYKLILYGIIFYLLKFEILKNEIKRESIFLIIIYSAFTLGLYVPYWLIKKNLKFEAALNTRIILLIFFLSCNHVSLHYLFGSSSRSNEMVLTALYWLGQAGYVVCFLVCIFSLRKRIAEKLKGIEINAIWTFFIGILHVQFSLNQYIRRHEK